MFLLMIVTAGLSSLVFMFIYNKIYIKGLIKKGFKPVSVEVGPMETISEKLKIDLAAV